VTAIDGIDTGSSRVHMRIRGREGEIKKIPVRIALPAVYNIYNAAAALTAYTASKLPLQEILKGLEHMQSSFGRMEHFKIGGVSIQMILVKNPAGCNQALDYLCALEEPCTLVLCLNDLDADGHDISWIWDVDYEKLCGRGNIRRILVWGKRAEDLQLRLKYAGLQEKRTRRVPERELKKLLEAIYKSQVPVFILPNYTTMLPLRDALRRAAGKDSFWKG
jgi:UDP-N-acetylmuramyl tripeptide synthase